MEHVKKPLGKGVSIVLLVMILVLILVGYFFIILKPLLTEINGVQTQTAQTQVTLDGLRIQQEKYVQMKQALKETEKSDAAVPDFDNEAALLRTMNLVMNDALTCTINADIDSDSDSDSDEEYANHIVLRRSFDIAFTCQNIWQAQKLMDGLREMPYRSQISALTLVSGDDTSESLANIWSSSIGGNLIITFYEAI